MDIAWPVFLIASVIVIITPGQDMVLVMSRSIAHGAAAGIWTAAGVSTGLLMHTILATLGVGAIVRTSDWLFLAMKVIGACYLLYLGVTLLRTRATEIIDSGGVSRSSTRLFFDGAISNIANPKIAIFYFAFLPQFVGPVTPDPLTAIFVLGASFALLTFLIKAPVGFFAGRLSTWFRTDRRRLQWVYRFSGLMLIGLSLRLVMEEHP